MNKEESVFNHSNCKSKHRLSSIRSPADLKNLNTSKYLCLAAEIRERIIQVMAKNGGHLASNLGAVDFTVALHAVFSSPHDKIIFDVSHQAYTHKLLTGRNDERFDLIRKSHGLSGFCHPKESMHDQFFAGHAGTALSLALGMAYARDLMGGNEHIIAVIGDATLTCGLTFEALNNITRSLKRFIVVLNDNAMSISQNVGGITNILSRMLSNPTTCRYKRGLSTWLRTIPGIGNSFAKQASKIAGSMKNLVSSAPFFEQFGLSYIGPIDGHDIKKLISVFSDVRHLTMPVLVHLYTKKGYGLKKAEEDPITYHGVRPFDPATCEFLPTPPKMAFPKVFGKKIVSMGEQDSSLVAITAATSLGASLDPFMQRFKSRAWDVGIAEGHAVTFAGGLAKGKAKVVCSIYATFLQRALDNLFQDVCLQGLPVLFAIDRAGLAFADGATHHGIYDIGFLKTMPNMVVCQPRDGDMLADLLHSAFQWNRPVAIRYPNLETTYSESLSKYRPLGQAELIADGEDLLIIALGHMTKNAQIARARLETMGITAAVLDPIFVKPLDQNLLLELMKKHRRIVTVEEHALKGGLAAEIAHFILQHKQNQIELLSIGIPDVFYDHKDYAELIEELGMSGEKIAERVLHHFFSCEYGALR